MKRNAIATRTFPKHRNDEEIAEAACHVGTGTIFNISALIGIWALACLSSAILQYGVLDVIRGWISAVGLFS